MTSPDQPDSESDVPEQFRIRQAKRERLLDEGREPYPVEVSRTHTLAEIRQAYPELAANTETGQIVGVAGRVMFARNSGKLCFATLQEGDGTQLQVMISLDRVGQESLDAWKGDVDLGDIVYVHGEVISSRRGELSVLSDSWQIVSKALRPLPVAHKEMSEESRVRQRYVDLIVRPEARTIARQRVAVVRAVRSALERRGFLEVETPIELVLFICLSVAHWCRGSRSKLPSCAQAEGQCGLMAKKVTVTLVDDFDGEGAADETVEFGLDGVSYEIDLYFQEYLERTERLEAMGGCRPPGRGPQARPFGRIGPRTGGDRS